MDFERKGRGPTLLLFSGLGCDCRMWESIRDQLAAHFDVICPHTWGHDSLEDRARRTGRLLDRLGVKTVAVAGLSMGGYIAFECMRQWPQRIRALALLDTTAEGDDRQRIAQRRQVLHRIREGHYEEVLETFLDNVLSPSHGPGSKVYRLMSDMARELGPETFAADVEAILRRGSFTDVLRTVRVPTLFLVGAEDTLTPPETARRMSKEIPGSRVHVIHEAGHMSPLENPHQVLQRLEPFLRAALLV